MIEQSDQKEQGSMRRITPSAMRPTRATVSTTFKAANDAERRVVA
jgi:hypothetical protein